MTTDSHTNTYAPLRGTWLTLARVTWIILALCAIVAFVAGLPGVLDPKNSLCGSPTKPCMRTYLLPDEAALLPQIGLSLTSYHLISYVSWSLLFPMIWLGISALIFWRRSNERIAVITALFMIGFPFSLAVGPGDTPPLITLAYGVVLLFNGILGIFFFIFPTGTFVPRWSRWVAYIFLGLWALRVGVQVDWMLRFSNDAPPTGITATFNDINGFLYFAVFLFSAGCQVYRYLRISNDAQRRQTTWIFISILSLPVLDLLMRDAIMPLLFPILFKPGVTHILYNLISEPLWISGFLLVPLAFAISIFRYRLFDIDFVINRSLVYGALTAILFALFGLSLFIVSQLFQDFAGGPLVAVAISAAAFGGIFQPARRNLQRFVDQRFYNIQIDYQKTPPPGTATSGMTQVLRQTHFGAYQNLELIGRGGMAEVYKSTHPTLGQPVAIKILPAHLATEADFRQRFTREAQVVAKLEHPNIIRVFDSGEQDGMYYMVMEYLAGKDLGELIKANGKLSLTQTLPLVHQIATALDYAHTQGLVHRDIKPSNILLDTSSNAALRAVLTDFGITKIINARTAMTRTGGMLGTLDYIAPEQIQASANVDSKADIYALGVMVYQMLTGELPFKHNHPGALLIAHLTQPPPNPRETLPDLPKNVASAIQRAMAKKPDERFATATEFSVEMSNH